VLPVIIISSFLCVALLAMSIIGLVLRPKSIMDARLDDMDPTLSLIDAGGGASALAGRVAEPINKLIPISASEANKLRKQLFYAGYRGKDAPTTFRALQLVLMAAVPGVVLAAAASRGVPMSTAALWAVLGAGLGFYLPRYVLKKKITARQLRITCGLADALDLLVITVEAGLGLNAALVRVGEELKGVHRDIYEEFEMVNLEIRVGRARDEALRNLVERTGVDDLRSFVALMIQADRFGSSIARAVRVFSDSLRTKRRQRAEQSAQKASLKLLFPLTFFLFPTIIMVILGPSILNLIDLLG